MYSLETISSITIELTSHCNAKCPQCGRFDIYNNVLTDLPIKHLPLNLLEKLPTEKMKNLKNIHFNGNYGEPLMHPDIEKILKKFKNQNIIISTNGSLRDKEWWGRLGQHKNVTVIFALDGLNDTHSLYRKNTNYDKVLSNAISFIKNGGNAGWQFIVFKHNQHQVTEAKILSQQLGFRSIRFQYSDRFLKDKKTIVYENNKQTHILEQASDQDTIHELTKSNQNEFYTKKLFKIKHDTIECPWAKQKKLFINNVGWVLPCCHMANILAGKQIYKKLFEKIIGSYDKINLHYYSLEQILLSEIYLKQIPNSIVSNRPHPNCIEHCSPTLGKRKIKSNESTLLNS